MLHDAMHGISQGVRGNQVNYKESEAQNIADLQQLGGDVSTPPSGNVHSQGELDAGGADFSRPPDSTTTRSRAPMSNIDGSQTYVGRGRGRRVTAAPPRPATNYWP